MIVRLTECLTQHHWAMWFIVLLVWEAWREIHLSRVLPTLLVVMVLGAYRVTLSCWLQTELPILDREPPNSVGSNNHQPHVPLNPIGISLVEISPRNIRILDKLLIYFDSFSPYMQILMCNAWNILLHVDTIPFYIFQEVGEIVVPSLLHFLT